MPHLIRRMRCLLKDNKKTLYKNLVIYNIRTFTILSPQNKGGTGTFKLHKIYKSYNNCCQWIKKSDFEINAAVE